MEQGERERGGLGFFLFSFFFGNAFDLILREGEQQPGERGDDDVCEFLFKLFRFFSKKKRSEGFSKLLGGGEGKKKKKNRKKKSNTSILCHNLPNRLPFAFFAFFASSNLPSSPPPTLLRYHGLLRRCPLRRLGPPRARLPPLRRRPGAPRRGCARRARVFACARRDPCCRRGAFFSFFDFFRPLPFSYASPATSAFQSRRLIQHKDASLRKKGEIWRSQVLARRACFFFD